MATITISESTEKTFEFNIPHFRKSSCHYFKVFSENKCIMVKDLKGYESIEITTTLLAFGNTIECSEEEFESAFKTINQLIKNTYESTINNETIL